MASLLVYRTKKSLRIPVSPSKLGVREYHGGKQTLESCNVRSRRFVQPDRIGSRLPSRWGASKEVFQRTSAYSTMAFWDPLKFSNQDLYKSQRCDSWSEPKSTTVLAYSNVDTDTAGHYLRRLVAWIQQLLQSCWNTAVLTARGTEVALRLSPLAILTPASILSARFLSHSVVSDASWWYFTSAMQSLGPAFVKLCQWVATRRDIFPPHVCDRLSSLHDRGIPHSWKYTDQILRESFGSGYETRGLKVDSQSVIGCGSAAQVYSGTLSTTLKDGTEERTPVAIKVLHPRFAQLVERDLWFMQSIADLVHSLPFQHIKMVNLPRATQNFGAVLQRQADLRIEGNNLKTFRNNFYRNREDEYNSAILFPKPVDEWTTRTILVEDLVRDATPISDYLRDSSDSGKEIRKELAGPLLRGFLKMVFLDNFVHCDLHPGNVLIQTSQVKPEPPTFLGFPLNPFSDTGEKFEIKRSIVFLDAGIATSLSSNDQRNLKDLFRAVITNDGERAGRLMVERAKFERCSLVEGGVDAFAGGIQELVSEFHDRRKEGLTLGAVRIGSLLSRVLDLCRVHGVEIDPAMASIVISTLVLEGLGRSLEPSLNLIDFALPFVLGRGRV
jgi:aarF domain-containing kinase